MLFPVYNERFRDFCMPLLDQHLFDDVLNLFHCGDGFRVKFLSNNLFNLLCERKSNAEIIPTDGLGCLIYRIGYFIVVIRYKLSVALSDGFDHPRVLLFKFPLMVNR